MNHYGYLISVFIAMGLVSAAERMLPFVASRFLLRQRWVRIVGDFLPLAIMVLLVVHSATGAALSHAGLPVPEVAAILVTFILQWFLRNPLLSIFCGTACYVVLLNTLFSAA